MARLNELPMAPESIETLRRKMYRQNRDLARSNNVRALRIKELENDCACMLSENLELRARILALERQIENNEARRIADQALAIKEKLESQLAEWGMLIAGLGLEPPIKRDSPGTRRSIRKRRTSFFANRPSPSQRRLRDVTKEIEELGHIPENKSYQRRSMNPEQILALRSEADISNDSIDLGPPPISHFVEDGSRLDSPSRPAAERTGEQDSQELINTEEEGFSHSVPIEPIEDASVILSHVKPEPEDHTTLASAQSELENGNFELPAIRSNQPAKAGSKRKRAAGDDGDISHQDIVHETKNVRALTEKSSSRQKTSSRIPTEISDEDESGATARKPLANKSTNDDVGASRKRSKMKPSALDETMPSKNVTIQHKAAKIKSKTTSANTSQNIATRDIEATCETPAAYDLATPITEALLAPDTPEPAAATEAPRGDTPPPTDISFKGETSGPSRRNRATISYAEPNLRDKMRRPTKELLDAVAGEGKYRRRTSHEESSVPNPTEVKCKSEPIATDNILTTDTATIQPESENIMPASPPAEGGLPLDDLPSSVVTERRKRSSNAVSNARQADDDITVDDEEDISEDLSIGSGQSELQDADVYEFTSSSPQENNQRRKNGKRNRRRQTTSSTRSSVAADGENDRGNTRRRSMMI